MPSYEINIKTTDDPRGIQNATEETAKLTDAMGKLLERAKRKEEYAAAKEALAGMTQEEQKAALAAYQLDQANDKAAAGLTNLEKAVRGTRTTIGGLDSDIKVFGKNVGSATDMLSGLGVSIPISGMQAFGSAVRIAGDFVKSSINDYTAYVEEVDRVATYSGMASEETSRLIQVADDLRIESKTVELALKSMADNGTTPSIQGIAKLSDEYRSLNDPLLRAQFLTDNFGRSGMEMARMMELGSEKILDLAAAVEDYMIITGKSKEEAEAYLRSQDNLQDSYQGIKYQIGESVVPQLSIFIDALLKSNQAVQDGGGKWMNIMPILSAARLEYILFKTNMEVMTDRVNAQTGEVTGLANAWGTATSAASGYGNPSGSLPPSTYCGIPGHPNYPHTHGSMNYPTTSSGNRAAGGPVAAGQLYAINENRPWQGPEYFLAPTDGVIIPSGPTGQQGLGGGGQVTPLVLEYKPLIGLGDREEAVNILLPYIKEGLRKIGVKV